MERSTEYMDRIYEYRGLWDIPSKCGLKVVEKEGSVVVIVTELYDDNPGTSVTKWSAQLATMLFTEFGSDPEKFTFIEHAPNMKSKLSFYDEAFYRVSYERTNDRYVNPKWEGITREQVDSILACNP